MRPIFRRIPSFSTLMVGTLVLGISLIAILGSCREERAKSPDQQSFPLLNTAIAFPHPREYKALDRHGFDSINLGKAACTGCHGDDLRGGTSKVSCTECHASYPHFDWKSPEAHGKSPLTKNEEANCLGCHGAKLNEGLYKQLKSFNANDERFPLACKSCHNFPHDSSWISPISKDFHGLVLKTTDQKTCQKCHGEKLDGNGDQKKSCLTCHKDYPHQPDFLAPQKHGTAYKNHGDDKTPCFSCHNVAKETASHSLKSTNPSCESCHTYPHPSGWSAKNHGQAALLSGHATGKSDCTSCHGKNYQGGTSQVSCFSCHSNYPHKTQWHSPKDHGALFKTSPNDSNCSTCHGTDYRGGNSKTTCYSCHESYPHAAKGQKSTWFEPDQHGKAVLAAGSIEKAGCPLCHGADHKGGTSGVSCTQCHTNYPHIGGEDAFLYEKDNPLHHSQPVVKNGGKRDVCAGACHGPDLKGGDTKVSCTTCHE